MTNRITQRDYVNLFTLTLIGSVTGYVLGLSIGSLTLSFSEPLERQSEGALLIWMLSLSFLGSLLGCYFALRSKSLIWQTLVVALILAPSSIILAARTFMGGLLNPDFLSLFVLFVLTPSAAVVLARFVVTKVMFPQQNLN